MPTPNPITDEERRHLTDELKRYFWPEHLSDAVDEAYRMLDDPLEYDYVEGSNPESGTTRLYWKRRSE